MKAKATQLQSLLEEVVKASNLYYLQNGVYPKNFSDLDINIDLPAGTRTCLTSLGFSDTKQGKDFQISIYSGSGTNSSFDINIIAAYFTTGKYKCRGFEHSQYWKGYTESWINKSYCMEGYYNLDCGTNCELGIFCQQIMGKPQHIGSAAGGQMQTYE